MYIYVYIHLYTHYMLLLYYMYTHGCMHNPLASSIPLAYYMHALSICMHNPYANVCIYTLATSQTFLSTPRPHVCIHIDMVTLHLPKHIHRDMPFI